MATIRDKVGHMTSKVGVYPILAFQGFELTDNTVFQAMTQRPSPRRNAHPTNSARMQ